jgi:hypothetical protein
MRFVTVSFCLLFTLPFISCKKSLQRNNSHKIQINSSTYVSWKTCSQAIYKSDVLKICFDSLIEDSRCPTGAECIWQGVAVVKFSFSVNDNHHDLVLSPQPSPVFLPSDTSLMGYKIEFVSLQPYPHVGKEIDLSDYKAELMITKQ